MWSQIRYNYGTVKGGGLKRISNMSLKCDVKYSLKKLFTFALSILTRNRGVKLRVSESFEQPPPHHHSGKHTLAAVRLLQKLSKHDLHKNSRRPIHKSSGSYTLLYFEPGGR